MEHIFQLNVPLRHENTHTRAVATAKRRALNVPLCPNVPTMGK